MTYEIQDGPPPAMMPLPSRRGRKSRYALKDLLIGQFIRVPFGEYSMVSRAVRHATRYHGMRFQLGRDATGKLAVLRIS
jgi:hypothetical protein